MSLMPTILIMPDQAIRLSLSALAKTTAILTLLLTATPLLAANWVQIGSYDEFDYYVDTETVKRDASYPSTNQQIRYFTKWVYHQAQKTYYDGKLFNYSVFAGQGDCGNDEYVILGGIDYLKNGTSVDSWTNSSPEWQSVYPDTVGESELHAACYWAGYRDTP